MPLSDYALGVLDELKTYLNVEGDTQDDKLEGVANRGSSLIEAWLDRQIVSRPAMSEFHIGGDAAAEYAGCARLGPHIYLREYPILIVTSVHESSSRTYDATTVLAADTDYLVSKREGRLTRVAGANSGPRDWLAAYRGIKVIYTAGYAQDAVPGDIKDVWLKLCAVEWAEIDRKQHGISGMSDATGNYTRFAAARLTPEMKEALSPHRRYGLLTGEQD